MQTPNTETATLVAFLNAGITPIIPIKGENSIDKLCSDMIFGRGNCHLVIGKACGSGYREYIELPVNEAMAAVGIDTVATNISGFLPYPI